MLQILISLRLAHFITIAVFAALIAILYIAGNTVAPKKDKKAGMQAQPGEMTQSNRNIEPASFDSILISCKGRLTETANTEVRKIETGLSSAHDSSRMISAFLQLSKVWGANKEQKISAYYSGLAAKLENSEKKLTFAARIFLELMADEENPAMRMWEAQQSVSLAGLSLAIDSSNEETKLALATGYIEGTGEPMRGVQLLLGIVREKPNNIPANLLLGQMSVQSGQLDKAIGRFETVLKQDSLNKEALYYLAQAYRGKGENKKAIELLEKCKRIVNDPEFSSKADQEINSLK